VQGKGAAEADGRQVAPCAAGRAAAIAAGVSASGHDNILFICGGAFRASQDIGGARKGSAMGFGADGCATTTTPRLGEIFSPSWKRKTC